MTQIEPTSPSPSPTSEVIFPVFDGAPRPDAETAPAATHGPAHTGMLAALGVVFGDIGTSPIYTLDTAFKSNVIVPTPVEVEGFLSLIVWSLFIVVGTWYALLIMRADNHGEGGIFALTALASKAAPLAV
ncbi:MAG: hypothetical protein GX458_21295 [Phyllobacteriaceae bacterium]|nr:hypothetical protein [Phyllobacteriaceae bacterium]